MSDYKIPVFKWTKDPVNGEDSQYSANSRMFRVSDKAMGEARRKLAKELRPKIREAVTSGVEGAYYCNKEWWAWNAGTMNKDDFVPAEESDELIDTIVDKILSVMNL